MEKKVSLNLILNRIENCNKNSFLSKVLFLKTTLFIADLCKCTGKSNAANEGSKCDDYSGYNNDWLNGRWCYAETSTCPDARAHPSTHPDLTGFGASRKACMPGKVNI